ncbi:hypothetical protein Tco_0546261 [Tanacetum coccineum]
MFKRGEHSFETYKSEMFLSLLSFKEAKSFHLSCVVLLSNPFNLLLADEDIYNGCNKVMKELFLFSVYNLPRVEGSTSGTSLLFTEFLASMTLGIVLMAFLKKRDGEEIDGRERILLMVSYTFCFFVEASAFVWAEFTKYYIQPSLGESGVGDAMAVYGIFDAIFTSGLSSITLIFSGGAFLPGGILIWLKPTGVLDVVFLLLIAAVWGIGDGEALAECFDCSCIIFKFVHLFARHVIINACCTGFIISQLLISCAQSREGVLLHH